MLGLHRMQVGLVLLNLVGGIAVLGSYVIGIAWHPTPSDTLWGGLPDGFKGLYTVNMFLAAFGYFPFTVELVLRSDPERARFGPFGYSILYWVYFLILIPSALWLPLTFAYAAAPSDALWWLVRADLFAVGLGSTGILASLIALRPRASGAWRIAALVGWLPFWLQTAVLDATIWPYWYHAAAVR